ncbi:MAP3K12-binding inhibitory protein 1 isoform X1 [Hemibagrus wyckioides]|uniref:MAP3K12-binding inhibitory protein 1 isoform X1 n=1 Tax=Hemibagrus wyckioides TaxID=337641 RepID=UPI00266DACE4|nr:MAP3K12-binding inhibitory protein 1 isoform X1 [Hemibagrus wyckioides]
MAASEMVQESCKNKKRKASTAEMSPDGLTRHSFQECFSSLIESITKFSTEIKINPEVLRISANLSAVNFPQLQPSHVYNCLQQHISKLQTVSVHLKEILAAESPSDSANNEKTENSKDRLASEEEIVVDKELFPTTSQHTASKDKVTFQPDDCRSVQIKAGKAEIERRISAFIERKQLEINENNVREFCNVISCNRENSCARTDAVFTPYPGFKSHVKVTRVVNTYGPQTRGGRSEQGEQQQGSYSRDCGNPVIEERLHNIEAHLKLTAAGPVPQSIYQRLKKLEDRILELEGLSPEYFHSTSYSHKRQKISVSQSYSLSEIDGKISAVRSALLKRASEFQSRDEETGEPE